MLHFRTSLVPFWGLPLPGLTQNPQSTNQLMLLVWKRFQRGIRNPRTTLGFFPNQLNSYRRRSAQVQISQRPSLTATWCLQFQHKGTAEKPGVLQSLHAERAPMTRFCTPGKTCKLSDKCSQETQGPDQEIPTDMHCKVPELELQRLQ